MTHCGRRPSLQHETGFRRVQIPPHGCPTVNGFHTAQLRTASACPKGERLPCPRRGWFPSATVCAAPATPQRESCPDCPNASGAPRWHIVGVPHVDTMRVASVPQCEIATHGGQPLSGHQMRIAPTLPGRANNVVSHNASCVRVVPHANAPAANASATTEAVCILNQRHPSLPPNTPASGLGLPRCERANCVPTRPLLRCQHRGRFAGCHCRCGVAVAPTRPVSVLAG